MAKDKLYEAMNRPFITEKSRRDFERKLRKLEGGGSNNMNLDIAAAASKNVRGIGIHKGLPMGDNG